VCVCVYVRARVRSACVCPAPHHSKKSGRAGTQAGRPAGPAGVDNRRAGVPKEAQPQCQGRHAHLDNVARVLDTAIGDGGDALLVAVACGVEHGRSLSTPHSAHLLRGRGVGRQRLSGVTWQATGVDTVMVR